MKKSFTKEQLQKALEGAWNLTEVARNLGYANPSGQSHQRLRDKYQLLGIDISNLHKGPRHPKKWQTITKECPVCLVSFMTQRGHSSEKTVCSRACANTYFRSGVNNPNYKHGELTDYRTLALRNYPHECCECNWNKHIEVLQVHHIDFDRANNTLANLEVLCPTCHYSKHFLSGTGKWSG